MKSLFSFLTLFLLFAVNSPDAQAIDLKMCEKRLNPQTNQIVFANGNPDIKAMCSVIKIQSDMVKIMKLQLQQSGVSFSMQIPKDLLSMFQCIGNCNDGSAGVICKTLGFDAFVSHSYQVNSRSVGENQEHYISALSCETIQPTAPEYFGSMKFKLG